MTRPPEASASSTGRPQIIDISFSPLMTDARVLRQLSIVTQYGDVTTVGYGDATPFSTDHISIPADKPSLAQTPGGVLNLALHRYPAVDLQAPGTQYALQQLVGRRFDAIIANDARALPLAVAIANGGTLPSTAPASSTTTPIWVDLHEWAPEERTHITSWRLLVAPWIDHVCRTYLPMTEALF